MYTVILSIAIGCVIIYVVNFDKLQIYLSFAILSLNVLQIASQRNKVVNIW